MDKIFKESTNKERLPFIGIFLFVFAIFYTFKISFLLNINEYVVSGILTFTLLIFAINCPRYFQTDNQNAIFIFLFYFGALLATRGNLNSYIGITLLVIPFVFFVLLKDDYKLDVLNSFDTLLSITIAISLCAWILFLVGVQLPHNQFDWKSYSFDNYYLFLKLRDIFYAFPRFQYIFTEPGYFGCLCVIMIFLRKYNFKSWKSIVYFVALIMTFSLAGYALFFFGLIAFIFQQKTKKFKYVLVFIILVFTFYYLVSNNDNVMSSMFAYRLNFEDGSLSGYNPTSDSFDAWWDSYFLSHGNWLWGNNDIIERVLADDELIGVDLRAFTARFGLVPLIFYFGSMLYYYKKKKSKLGFFYFLLFVLFYYRGYTVMFYMGFPILFVAGISLFCKNTLNK